MGAVLPHSEVVCVRVCLKNIAMTFYLNYLTTVLKRYQHTLGYDLLWGMGEGISWGISQEILMVQLL